MRPGLKLAGGCLCGILAAATASAQDAGANIYKSKCARCHGADGMSHTFEGKMTRAAALSEPAAVAMTDADLIAVVRNGKKKMPAFAKKLNDEQIESVVAYVRTLQKAKTNPE